MTLRKLKALTGLLVIGIWTACIAQTTNDSITCIETKKVDYLLEWRLRAKSLMNDTSIMGNEIRLGDEIIEVKDRQISNLGDVITLKDTVINKQRVSYLDLVDKYAKKEKRIRFYKTTTVTFISTTAILILVFVALFKF